MSTLTGEDIRIVIKALNIYRTEIIDAKRSDENTLEYVRDKYPGLTKTVEKNIRAAETLIQDIGNIIKKFEYDNITSE